MEALGSFVMEERLVIDEDATATNKGAAKWGGALEGRGRFINDAGRTPLVMVGGRVFKLEQSAVFENRGVIEHERGARLSIDESSQLENKGTYNLRGAISAGSEGVITNRPAATFRLAEESETQTIQCTMDNQGKVVASKLSTLNLLGEVVQIGGEALTSGEWVAENVGRIVFGDGVLIRENRATIRLRGNGDLPNLPIASNPSGGDCVNQGVFLLEELESRGTTYTAARDFDNVGLVRVHSGCKLDVPLGDYDANFGSRTIVNGEIDCQTYDNSFGAKFSGDGMIRSMSFDNGGDLSSANSPGILTLTGNFNQGATGRLFIELGGTEVGSGYDQLVIGGTALLGGTLALCLLDASSPPSARP
jgi:hypothetical protein